MGRIKTLKEIQREAVQRALVTSGGNLAEASRLLAISETTLRGLARELGLLEGSRGKKGGSKTGGEK